MLRRLVRRLLPHDVRQLVRRYSHARAIARGRFGEAGDPFFDALATWVRPGDWVVDVGAAVGTYAITLSRLVGDRGRVIALEPMPAHFELLVSNVAHAPHANVTCLQMAAGAATGSVGMRVPLTHGAPDWYLAHISEDGPTRVLCVALDALPIQERVRFLKIDAEGHDFGVLLGAEQLIARDSPAILIEDDGPDTAAWLGARGYSRHADERSPNRLYTRETR